MAQPKRRTKKQYAQLFDNPHAMFPGDTGPASNDAGMYVTLYPNGARAIWIRDSAGRGYEITASRGPAGVGLHVRQLGDGEPMTINADTRSLDVTAYDADRDAQAYKRWYAHEETDEDIALLGESYRRPSHLATAQEERA